MKLLFISEQLFFEKNKMFDRIHKLCYYLIIIIDNQVKK